MLDTATATLPKSLHSALPDAFSDLSGLSSQLYSSSLSQNRNSGTALNPQTELEAFKSQPKINPIQLNLSSQDLRDLDNDRRIIPSIAIANRDSSREFPPNRDSSAAFDSLTGIKVDAGLVTATRSDNVQAQNIQAQQTVDESLSSWDNLNPTRTNTYKDDYWLQSDTSRQVQLDLASSIFDAYLQIVDSRTGAVVQYDDDSGSGTNARLTFTMQAGVGYIVRATSYGQFETGNYTLTLSAPSSQPPSNGFDSAYGYGLVNAAAAVAQSINTAPFAPVSDSEYSWSNNMVGAPEAWVQGYTGRNVVVAVVDTGVDYTHSDLDANIWRNAREISGNGIDDDGNGYVDDVIGWDFAYGDNNPMDVQGHGTHVAGTIAAENDGFGITGVAYNAQIMPVKVLGDDGSGTNLSVAQGIRYAADNGAHVINLSLGGGYSAEIESAIDHAVTKGAIVVMAAGNEGADQPGNPASIAIRRGLSVGAIDSDGYLASFSNRAGTDSRMQHVVAPGVSIESTFPGNRYESLDGTSMAAPHVAGVVALMLQANPALTDSQVREIITSSAIRATSSSFVNSSSPSPVTTTLSLKSIRSESLQHAA